MVHLGKYEHSNLTRTGRMGWKELQLTESQRNEDKYQASTGGKRLLVSSLYFGKGSSLRISPY
jgi:hypothetical protein